MFQKLLNTQRNIRLQRV